MKAKYIIRLDDACPSMDPVKWGRIEDVLDGHGIRPIAAVIPNCEDEELPRGHYMDDFWGKVKKWEAKGWDIALHGYNHVYVTDNPGLVPINKKSEFAGLPLEKQAEKLKTAYGIFLRNGIKPKIFVAPAHSFDENTLKAIERETDIRIVSDGLAFRPYFFKGFEWIPQQLWKFRPMPFGLWTICLHPDTMEEKDFGRLEACLAGRQKDFIRAGDVVCGMRRKDAADRVFEIFFLARNRFRRSVKF